MDYSNYYSILGIGENAPAESIKAAYRKQALLCHPDTNGSSSGAQARFLLVSNAYTVLMDAVKKTGYDSYLKTSGSVRRNKKESPAAAGGTRSGNVSGGQNELFENQFNFILWDIEDLLREDRECRRTKAYDDLYFQKCVMRLLTFIEKWVLESAGFKDYFMESRRLKNIDPSVYVDFICSGKNRLTHFPFTNIENYFYDIRKRMNKYLDSMRASDILSPIGETGIRRIDALIDAQNYSFYCLGCLKKLTSGEIREIPAFTHSHPCFAWI